MPITLTVFIIVCSLFAFRGAMLGVIAWLTRILGLLSGYLLAFLYREDFAHIVSIYMRDWSPILLQVLCGIGLFFAGTILTNMFISSLIDLLRKTHKTLNDKLKNKTTQGRILGAACNSVLGAFVVFLGLWAYGIGQSFQLVPALPENNKNMQHIANKIGQASFGFLLTRIASSSLTLPAENNNIVVETFDSSVNGSAQSPNALPPALTLKELRQKVQTQQMQKNIQTATEKDSNAEITLIIEDVQGHALAPTFSNEQENLTTNGNDSLQNLLGGSNSSKQNINNELQKVLQNKALLTATLSQYMSVEEATAAGTKLQEMMKDPAMQKMMQENIEKMMNNPAAIQELLQKRQTQ